MTSPGIYAEMESANNLFPTIAPKEREFGECGKERREVNALSIEFVAKMHAGKQAQAAIAEAIEEALEQAAGFVGSLVLVSDEEKRLVTAITFWSKPGGAALSNSREPWVRKALAPFMEHCLRVGWFEASGTPGYSWGM